MEKLLIPIVLLAIPLGILYYLVWKKIETTAKLLVGAMSVLAVVYVGYDLLITVFSYGTWAVFFKKLVGAIIIVVPISYVLYWLEQRKRKWRLLAELNAEEQLNAEAKETLKQSQIVEYERLLSLGWSEKIATKRAYGENSEESLANPVRLTTSKYVDDPPF